MKGNCDEQKGKLKQKFSQLTDDDLLFAEGKKDEMPGRLQVKPGKIKDDWFKISSDNNRQNKMYINNKTKCTSLFDTHNDNKKKHPSTRRLLNMI